MNELYPLKFHPILKEKIWGGERLQKILNKDTDNKKNIGESWEISNIEGNISVVSEGFLSENNLEELIEIYMGDLVGDAVYEKFGNEFPLLIKFIDANDYLSVQVHPDDYLAKKRHNAYGKTEMWYVIEAEENAELVAGFLPKVNKNDYLQNLKTKSIKNILNTEKVKKGDVFFIPSGTVHCTGAGILFAEIQQTSDITYRIYDWDRVQEDGSFRELHSDLALDTIRFETQKHKITYSTIENQANEILQCPYFVVNEMNINKMIERDFIKIDSFIIYMGIENTTLLHYNSEKEPITIKKGETVLVPATLKQLFLTPVSETSKLLEIYIKNDTDKTSRIYN